MSCRKTPLLNPVTQRSWHEEMHPGQFAVHLSQETGTVPTCALCDTWEEAEQYACEEVEQRPTVRCRLYDDRGFVGAPLLEVTGRAFKGERDLSPRVRRWIGVGMLAVGLILCAIDWSTDFRLSWPGLVGSRLLIPGLVLLVTEGLVLLHAHQKALEKQRGKTPR